MKSSLPVVPRSWTIAPVSAVGSVRVGRQRTPDKQSGYYTTKYIRAANIGHQGIDLSEVFEMDFTADEKQLYAIREGDIVLAEASGSAEQVGRSALWTKQEVGILPECCFQNTVLRFRPHAVDSRYAITVFKHWSLSGVFSRLARGSGIQHLGTARFAAMLLPVPPLEEQRRIADAVEHKITEVLRARSALESALAANQRQAVAIRAAVLDGSLVPGAGPHEMPWVKARIGELGEILAGIQRTPDRSRGDSPLPYLRAANIGGNGLDLSPETGILTMDFSLEERERYGLRNGDIVIAEASGSSSHVGRAALCTDVVDGFLFQNTVIRFRCSEMVPEFAILAFGALADNQTLGGLARGSGILHLSASRFENIELKVPSMSVQQLFVDEAHKRLRASTEQAVLIEQSLRDISEMERSVYADAVNARLVEQFEAAEPAEDLLRRVGLPEKERPVAGDRDPNRRSTGVRPLQDIVSNAGGSLPVELLYRRAGFARDVAEDVERFYLALRSACEAGSLTVRRAESRTFVEVPVAP